jgi:ribosome-associated toxin RatA of RatAB toxin-antitoxin module
MKRLPLAAFCFLPTLVGLAGLPAAAQAGSGVAMSAEVRGGEIDSSLMPHPGTSVQWGRAVVLLAAPAADVMAVLQNYAGYQTFLPNFEASRVLSQRGAAALVYVQVRILHGTATIWAELKLRPRQAGGATKVIEATMLKGNVSRFEATWEVTPVDEQRTLVAFQIFVDPEVPVPTSLVNRENQKNARKAVAALRDLMAQRKPRAKA